MIRRTKKRTVHVKLFLQGDSRSLGLDVRNLCPCTDSASCSISLLVITLRNGAFSERYYWNSGLAWNRNETII
jgi:hypothetical protein